MWALHDYQDFFQASILGFLEHDSFAITSCIAKSIANDQGIKITSGADRYSLIVPNRRINVSHD